MPSLPSKMSQPIFAIFLLATLGVWACSYQKNKLPEYSTGEIPSALLNSVSYSMVSARVFQPYCISCHGNSGGVSLETYDSARGALSLIQQAVFLDKSMPKAPNPPLSPEDAQILTAWIRAGAPRAPRDGTPDTPLPPEPELEPTYASIRSMIIGQKCIRCHSLGGVAERVPLGTLDDLLNSPLDIVIPGNAEESDIVLVLEEGARKPMPPLDSGITPVSKKDSEIIKEWINNGATD